MQIPPQEEWSLELLNELQRAVPVLESSSFHLDDDDDDPDIGLDKSNLASQSSGSSSPGWVTPCDAIPNPTDESLPDDWGLRSGEELEANTSIEVFSDDAMALPMSTLTSGKRKTYPNKSTFQAHVCCVMDPAQVPRVLQTLKASPNYQSVRFWPHAYRIISPYDGQAHQGSCDGDDAGAGEKMLGLLTRMKLENLLLIVSRWDSGPPNRLGCELFRCLNEECKELLRELQQAVRASFPPEELMRPDLSQHPQDSMSIAKHEGESSSCCTDAECETIWDETEYLVSASNEAPRHAGRLFDLQPLGTSPAHGRPQRFHWATQGIYASMRLHRAAHIATLRQAALRDEQLTNEEVALDKAALLDAHIEVAQQSGLKAGRCPIRERAKGSRQHCTSSAQTATTASADEQIEQAAQMSMGRRKTMEATSLVGLHGPLGVGSPTEASDELDEEEVTARQREVMSRMTSEDLLRLGARLRGDRLGLEDRLGNLCKASEVIRTACSSSCDGYSSETPQLRSSMMIGNPVVKVSRRGTHLGQDSESGIDRYKKHLRGGLGCGSTKDRNRRGLQVVQKSDCRSSSGSGHLRQAGALIYSSR